MPVKGRLTLRYPVKRAARYPVKGQSRRRIVARWWGPEFEVLGKVLKGAFHSGSHFFYSFLGGLFFLRGSHVEDSTEESLGQ